MPVAGVFLGAKVEGDVSRGPVRLTRDAPWKIGGRLATISMNFQKKNV